MKSANQPAVPSSIHGDSLLFCDIVAGLSDPVLVIDTGCVVLHANGSYLKIFGKEPDGGPVRSFTKLMPDKEAAAFKSRILRLKESGESSFSTSSRMMRQDGKWETYELRVHTHIDAQGAMLFSLHLHSIVDLIEERQERAEKELRYQALAEHAVDAYFVHDFNGRFVEVNRRACLSLGYTRDELLGMAVTDIEQDFDMKGAQEQWAQIEPDANFTLYGHHKRRDGTIFPVEIHFGCTMWQGEKLFLGMVRDITERVQAEEKFRRMVEGAPDPIFIQTDRCFAYINPAACRLFGIIQPQELLGTPIAQRIHPDYRDVAIQRIRQLNDQHKPVKELFEQRFLRVDGSEVWVETKGEPIEYEGRHGALVFVRNVTERKLAEQRLWESTERFRVAFECSATGMCLLNVEGVFMSVNQAMCDIFRCGKDYLIGKHFNDITYSEDFGLGANAVSSILQGHAQSFTLEKRYIRQDGKVFWASVTTALVKDGGGKPVYLITQVSDITQRREMEQELKAKEAFSRAVMDHLPIGIAVNSVFPSVSFSYMNDKFPQYYRTTREALSDPDAFWNAVYEDPVFREDMKKRVLDDIQSGDPDRRAWENVPISRQGKKDRYVSAYNIQAPENNLEISTVMDVTQRIMYEQTLLKNAQRLEALHQVDQAILMGVDSPGEIAAKALYHLRSLLNTTQASIVIFMPDADRARVLARISKDEPEIMSEDQPAMRAFGNPDLLSTGEMDIAEDASQRIMPDHAARVLKEEGVCSFMQVPLLAEGKLIGTLNLGWAAPRVFAAEEKAIAQEVGSQVALAIEQRRMRKELDAHAADLEKRVRERTAQYEAANKELEAFSYSVSHDLRAPLRSVDGYVQILLEDYSHLLDEEGRRICGVISGSARHMGRLIDDLLSLSRVGRTEMSRVPVDIGGLALSIYCELTAEAARADMDVDIAPMPCVPADPTLMRQVLVNLLSNALKFSSRKEKTVIRVGCEDLGEEIVYFVKDHGAGFDQQYAGKLFGVFQRLHSTKEFEGTGVGLAIVQRIIQRHGGRVWAQGKPNEGATFYFALKKEEDHEPV